MAFKKGNDPNRAKGRPKGALNKATLAEEACERAGVKPFDLLVQKAVEGDESCIIQLCKHIEPPKKPIEVQVDPAQNTIRIIVEEYKK